MPSLITSILSADPDDPLFNKAMHDLFAEASKNTNSSDGKEGQLPQVHALNCLKDIYKSTHLGSQSEVHVDRGLDLAAHQLESDM